MTLECYVTGATNVFNLGFIPCKDENVVVLVTREVAQTNPPSLRELNLDSSLWEALIQEKVFLPWLVKVPEDAEILSIFIRKILKELSLTPDEGIKKGLNIRKDGVRRTAIELLSFPDITFKEISRISYDKIYFSSFDLSSCIILKETSPYLQCGFLNDDFIKFNIDETIDICKKYNFFSCGINLNFFSNSIVSQFEENDIQVTVYADNNISKVQAHNLWSNNVTSIFIDDPTEYI